MPRSRGHSGYDPTRQIIHSGVTYVTRPSGTTIQKNKIEVSGVTVAASNVQSAYGYPVHIGTAGIKVLSGATKGGGTSKYFTATKLGLSSITNLLVTGSAGPTCHLLAVRKLTNSEATVFYFKSDGTTRTYGVSFNYFAVGT